MKNLVIIALLPGLIIIPMLTRAEFPLTYFHWRLYHPVLGALMVLGLDVIGVGLIMLGATLMGWLAIWLKSAINRNRPAAKKNW